MKSKVFWQKFVMWAFLGGCLTIATTSLLLAAMFHWAYLFLYAFMSLCCIGLFIEICKPPKRCADCGELNLPIDLIPLHYSEEKKYCTTCLKYHMKREARHDG